MTQVDALIERLGYVRAPISRWSERSASEFLQCLAQAYDSYPEVFRPYADRVLRYANFWSMEKRRPIMGMTDIDRRGSFLGGFPWTSTAYPWPVDCNGDPLAPILQLNLSQLALNQLQPEQDFLFQVWGKNETGKLYSRSLAVAELNGEPDWTILPWKTGDLYYHSEGFLDGPEWTVPTDLQWYKKRVVGEYVYPDGDWHFSLGRNLDLVFGYADELLPKDDLCKGAAIFWQSLEELSETAPQMSTSTYSSADLLSGYFGGQMYAHRGDYADFRDYVALYSPMEVGEIDGDRDTGLYAWFDSGSDGKLSVLSRPSNPAHLYAYTD